MGSGDVALSSGTVFKPPPRDSPPLQPSSKDPAVKQVPVAKQSPATPKEDSQGYAYSGRSFLGDRVVAKGQSPGGTYVGQSPGQGPIAIPLTANPSRVADVTNQSLCLGPRGCDGEYCGNTLMTRDPSGEYVEFTAPGDPPLTQLNLSSSPTSYRPYLRDHKAWVAQVRGYAYRNRTDNPCQRG